MNCPKCSSYNPSDAVRCRNCGASMRDASSDRRQQPADRPARREPERGRPEYNRSDRSESQRRPAQRGPIRESHDGEERKYVIVGAVTVAAFIAVIILLITSIACTCGSCAGKPSEDYTGDIVGGDYDVSSGDVVSPVDEAPVE